LVSDAEAETSSLSGSLRPANHDNPSWMNLHLSSRLAPGTRLVVAIAPEFTIGFVRPSGLRSIPSSELNARPVAFTPIFCRTASTPRASHTRAKTNGLETLMIVKSYSASPIEWTLPLLPTTQTPNRLLGTRSSAG